MPFVVWQHPADENITLRAIARRIAALTKLKTQTKNQIHAVTATQETPDIVIKHINELLDVLDKLVMNTVSASKNTILSIENWMPIQ
jgi:hypothetical protein